MVEFISETLRPLRGAFDTAAMARGEPGLPTGFTWRGTEYRIASRLEQWKATSAEGGRAGGEVYLRRHYYRLKMTDGGEWVVYFVRQSPKSGSPRQRWFLLERAHGAALALDRARDGDTAPQRDSAMRE